MSEKDSMKKGKAILKRAKTEAPSQQQAPIESRWSEERQTAQGEAVQVQDAPHPEVVGRFSSRRTGYSRPVVASMATLWNTGWRRNG